MDPRVLVARTVEAGSLPRFLLDPAPFSPPVPCRLADTRGTGSGGGAFRAPSMSPGVARNFPAAGNCGIPPSAAAISFNFTVVRTQGLGYLLLSVAGGDVAGTSTLNYIAGQVVANSAVVGIGDAGAITVEVAGSQTDLIIDINGYYGGPLVTSLNGMSGDLALAAGENVTFMQSDGLLTLSAWPRRGLRGLEVRRVRRERRVHPARGGRRARRESPGLQVLPGRPARRDSRALRSNSAAPGMRP